MHHKRDVLLTAILTSICISKEKEDHVVGWCSDLKAMIGICSLAYPGSSSDQKRPIYYILYSSMLFMAYIYTCTSIVVVHPQYSPAYAHRPVSLQVVARRKSGA